MGRHELGRCALVGHDNGGSAGQRLEDGEAEALVRARSHGDVGGGEQVCDHRSLGYVTGEGHRQSRGPFPELLDHRPATDHGQPGVVALTMQRRQCVDGEVGPLLPGQASHAHQRAGAQHPPVGGERPEGPEVDPQRDDHEVVGADPFELRGAEARGADHPIERSAQAAIPHIGQSLEGDPCGNPWGQDRVDALVREQHRRHAA